MLRIYLVAIFTIFSIIKLSFGQILERFTKNGYYGYKFKKEIVVPPIYTDGPVDIYGYGVVQKNIDDKNPNEGKIYGMIDNNGQIVIPVEYQFVQKCQSTWKNEYGKLVLVKKNNKYGFLDIHSGKFIVPLVYEFIDFYGGIHDDPCKCFKEEYAIANRLNEKEDTISVLVDSYGNEVVFEDVKSIKNLNSHYKKQVFKLNYKNGDNTYLFLRDSFLLPRNMLYYYLDVDYKWNIFGSGKQFLSHLSNYVLIQNSEKQVGLVNVEKRWFIEPKYEEIKITYNRGYLLIHGFKNGHSIPINYKTGHEIFDSLNYKEIKYVSSGLYSFKKNGKYGLLDSESKLIKEAIYDQINEVDGEIIVVQNNKKGVIDKSGNVILPLIYTTIEEFIFSAYVVSIDGKYGYVGKDGKVIVKIDYDYYIKSKNGFKRKEWDNSTLVKIMPGGKSSFENNLDDPCYCKDNQCIDCNECFGNGRVFKTNDLYCKYCKGKGIYFQDGVRKTCDVCLGKSTEVKSSLCGKCNGCGKLKK